MLIYTTNKYNCVQSINCKAMQFEPEICLHRNLDIGLSNDYKSHFNSKKPFAIINDKLVYKVQFSQNVEPKCVQINLHAKTALFQMEQCTAVKIKPFQPKVSHNLKQVTFYIYLVKRPAQVLQLQSSQLQEEVKKDDLLINKNTSFSFRFKDIQMELRPQFTDKMGYGQIVEETILNFKKELHQRIEIIDDSEEMVKLFENYESKVKDLKVGGLKQQLQLIDRRVFGARMLHPKLMRNLGLKHIKGMLLHGPPGTGKTLIARQISKILKVEPKVVNGPEILNEFVGNSQKKIRELFEDAKRQQEQKGSKSQLHCIIFDQIDAICKKRGTQTSNAVYDLIVNQLLTCIDGINSLNNILVIGITNRKDLIDEAVLRPGRLQVHIQVNIPDEQGRFEVLTIHTELMKNNKFLDESVDMREIAKLAKNYTGAELEGVVKSSQSFALQKWKKSAEIKTKEHCKITQQDFLRGLNEIKPQFGKDNSILQAIIPKNKIKIQKYQRTKSNITKAIMNLQNGKHIFLIRGDVGVGKTVLAAECAIQNQFSFTKIINCDRFLGLNQGQIINEVVGIFEDAERCNNSFIILDDVLRLIDFVPLGQRYNSNILNLIINLIKKVSDPSKKQIILATATNAKQFEDLGLLRYFKHIFTLDKLCSEEINQALQTIGFEQASSSLISRSIQCSTVNQLVDISKIEKEKNVENWIKCWGQSQLK